MYLISARDNFWHDSKLATRDAIRDVDLVGENPSVKVTENQFLSKLKNKIILVLVHGYNNEQEDVSRAYAQIEDKIGDLVSENYDLVVGYIWPGGDDISDYFSAKKRADALARRFGIWMRKLSAKSAAMDVMGHSMGVRVILQGLRSGGQKVARNVFAMAAAVDNESIERGENFYAATSNSDNVVVFHSKYDPVLRLAYSVAEFDHALGLSGPEDPKDIIAFSNPRTPNTPSVYVVNCKKRIRWHGAYKRTDEIYTYIAAFLSDGEINQFETL